MKIAVRMDDITPDMDWEKFDRFKALLEEYGIRPLIGVVPDSQDESLNRGGNGKGREAFFEEIRRLRQKGWVVALHGYRHVYTQKKGGLFPLNHFSEFAGICYEKQKDMLCKAVEILGSNGITTDIFMAPAHSYDRNTLRALRELGFTGVTDGFGTKPYRYEGLTFYPVAFRLSLSRKRKKGTTTMVVHTNTMTEKDFARYRDIFEKEPVISYEELLNEPAVRRGFFGHALEYVLAWIKHCLVKFL